MKRIMIFAAACAALVACSKLENAKVSGNEEVNGGSAFRKGETVTITVSTPQTKVSSALDGTSGDITFKWENNDKIKVSVSGSDAEFTVSKLLDGGTSAEFTGEMPESGTTFDVQYPYGGVSAADLANQTYSSGKPLPEGKMLFKATGCSKSSNTSTLEAQFAALRLNLYGISNSVSSITVKGSSAATYTLSCSTAVTVGKTKDKATPFFIILPATESFASATVSVNTLTPAAGDVKDYLTYGKGIVVACTSFAPSSAIACTAGTIMNMPAVSLANIWAPVNCGYEPATVSPAYKGYVYARLYQWGRKDGQGYKDATYEDATYHSVSNILDGTSDLSSLNSSKFYRGFQNWYTGSDPAPNTLWNEESKSVYDPCPDGWRVPTKAELSSLAALSTKAWVTGRNLDGTEGGDYNGCLFDNKLFFPAAGDNYYGHPYCQWRGQKGEYWCSLASSNSRFAYSMSFYNQSSNLNLSVAENNNLRSSGCSVRCVQE